MHNNCMHDEKVLTLEFRNPILITWSTLSSPAVILVSERASPSNTTLYLPCIMRIIRITVHTHTHTNIDSWAWTQIIIRMTVHKHRCGRGAGHYCNVRFCSCCRNFAAERVVIFSVKTKCNNYSRQSSWHWNANITTLRTFILRALEPNTCSENVPHYLFMDSCYGNRWTVSSPV